MGSAEQCHGVYLGQCVLFALHAGLKPRPIKVVAVLGGGLMGSGIATALALAGIQVLLKEVSQQFLDVGVVCTGHVLLACLASAACASAPRIVERLSLRALQHRTHC